MKKLPRLRTVLSHPPSPNTFTALFTTLSHHPSPIPAATASTTIPLRTGRPRLVVLGTGWGGARLLRDVNPLKFDITVISPRNHFVFTPLLSSTCVGTLEARAVTLGVADLQPALKQPQNFFYAASAVSIHPEDRIVEADADGLRFFVDYDVLAISTGSQGSTFGIPGVEEHAHFLRDAADADSIRSKLIANWLQANIPTRSFEERDRLLHTVVVGGGPTGVEFAGDLAGLINKDLRSLDSSRAADMRVTLIEANQLLGSFDGRLREFAARNLVSAGVHLVKGVVKECRRTEIELTNGQIIPFGLCVWSTGVGPTPFTLSLPFAKTTKGRIAVDENLRVMRPESKEATDAEPKHMSDVKMDGAIGDVDETSIKAGSGSGSGTTKKQQALAYTNIFALGDCSANMQTPLPALAQVAEQQGKYLAKTLNSGSFIDEVEISPEKGSKKANGFVYRSMGSMATVGDHSAIIELQRPRGTLSWAGFSSFLAWRSAYLTRLGTMKARIFVAFNWTYVLLFGRDVSRW